MKTGKMQATSQLLSGTRKVASTANANNAIETKYSSSASILPAFRQVPTFSVATSPRRQASIDSAVI